MTAICFLPTQENVELQRLLKQEYIKTSYLVFINELLFTISSVAARPETQSDQQWAVTPTPVNPLLGGTVPGEQIKALMDTVLFVANKILLDNVYRYVKEQTGHALLSQLSDRTFVYHIHVSPFYISQVLEDARIQVNEIDRPAVENFFARKICDFIDTSYAANPNEYNTALVSLYEMMSQKVYHLQPTMYKFELIDFKQPMLIYSQRSQDAGHATYG